MIIERPEHRREVVKHLSGLARTLFDCPFPFDYQERRGYFDLIDDLGRKLLGDDFPGVERPC